MKMLLFYLALSLPLSSASSLHVPPIRQVYTFPNNTFIENIAVRSNSNLIITSQSIPTLYSIDPTAATPAASPLYTFPNATGLSGITETSSDTFALVSGIWDLVNTRATLGSLSVWTIDLRSAASPVIKHVASIANSTIFNGLAAVPGSTCLVLAADSAAGAVWRVDLRTGKYGVAFADPLFLPLGTEPGSNLGINGLSAAGKFLYFTNSAQGIFGRVEIDRLGRKAGDVEVVARIPVVGGHYDDFAIDGRGRTWIATHPGEVVEVDESGDQRIISDETVLLNPTSAAFGRGGKRQDQILYVTNGGAFVGNDLVDEGVVAIDVSQV